jgi:microcystin-dependent protein
MANPYLGEIRMFAGNFAPVGWALCNGQLLTISQNTALFSLLGTMYGGDGKNNFALPNLQASSPMHQGNGPGLTPRSVGDAGGEPAVTLAQGQLPAHTHTAVGTSVAASSPAPAGNLWAGSPDRGGILYSDSTSGLVQMAPNALTPSGGGTAHNNMPPYLAVSFIIALQGVFPTRG